LNIALTLITVLGDIIIVGLSASFLTRMIFGYLNLYPFVMFGTLSVFIFSVCVHVYIATKNLLTINKQQERLSIIAKLLIYPLGIWTIQESLKEH
jgi:ABC-type nickel/cobalt efflux system permease component RcnA